MSVSTQLSCGILSYNVRDRLRASLQSLRQKLPGCPVIVLDNASSDGSAAMVREGFSHVTVVESEENLWFARGCNELVHRCESPYVLLMNADVYLEDDRIPRLVEFMRRHHDLVVATPAIRDNGTLRHSAHHAMTPALTVARDMFAGKPLRATRWYREATLQGRDPESVFFAPKVTNCCCVVARDAFLKLGGFDPDLLLYWTEEAFALRVERAGLRQAVFGKSVAVHNHGSSTATLPRALLRAIYVRDRVTYMKKYFGICDAVCIELLNSLRPKVWHAVADYCSYAKYRSIISRTARRVGRAAPCSPGYPTSSAPSGPAS